MPGLVFLTRLSLQILGKTKTGVFPVSGFLVKPLEKEIVITPEPVTTFDRKKQNNVKKFDDVMSENCDVIAIFSNYG